VLIEPSPTSSSKTLVVVDVDGAVRHPGVVQLPDGMRVIDAIERAGGLTRSADTGALNLAELLIDGQQVVVPSTTGAGATPAEPPSADGAVAPSAAGPVSLNSASEAELETLPGIGPVLAAAIVQWRTDNGGFTSIDQLQDVSGIGPATFAELAPLVRL
jgi:competence protein ComEA